jgi:AcrR family transcriptional regulator
MAPATRSADPPRRRLPAAERRNMIVEAAGRLFGERGYERGRLDEIAAAAGVTKPILYRHFGSKEALYLALLERHRDDLATFPALIPTEGPIEERLRTVLELWLDYVEAHSYAWRMLFRDSGGGPRIDSFRRDVHARARAVLAEIIDALGEEAIPPEEVAALAELMSMGMASLVLWWMDGAAIGRDAVRDAIARTWAGLLTARV